MDGQGVQPQVAQVAEAIHARTDDLAMVLARAIMREVHLYREAGVVPFDVLTASCAANVRPIFAAICFMSSVFGGRIERFQFGLDLTSHLSKQPDGPPTAQVAPADLGHVGLLDRPRCLHIFALVHRRDPFTRGAYDLFVEGDQIVGRTTFRAP